MTSIAAPVTALFKAHRLAPLPKDAVVVVEEEARGQILRGRLTELLFHPGQRGVTGDVDVDDASGLDLHDDEHISDGEEGGVLGEEVACPDHSGMIANEGAPGLISAGGAMNYPREIKAFYMRANDDGRTVAAIDILAPGISEIGGGSQREERLEVLDRRIEEMKLNKDAYWWFRDLRLYGTVPHAGFGLGFDRALVYATGIGNIRDVIPFPRAPKGAEF